jgi:hypothetical protein
MTLPKTKRDAAATAAEEAVEQRFLTRQSTDDTLVGVFTVSVQENRILLPSHKLIDDDQVRFVLGTEPVNALPPPLVEGTYYFVVGARGNDFQVALTQGGSVVVITDRGVGGTNEVWKQVSAEPEKYVQQMSSTVQHEITNYDFAVLKLVN